MSIKPSWKTTEFWTSLIVSLVGVVASLGFVTPDQADALTEAIVKIGGIAATALAQFGYAVSRGLSKKSIENFSRQDQTAAAKAMAGRQD